MSIMLDADLRIIVACSDTDSIQKALRLEFQVRALVNTYCIKSVMPDVALRISGACSDARMVRTVCSKALSAMLVASATVIADPPTAFDNTSYAYTTHCNSIL